jgi:sec-independent protein translocase protein TatA
MSAVFASLFGGQDWVVLLIVGFILFVVFGRRLPEVGRSLGKGITEFKKGMKGLEDDTDTTFTNAPNNNQPQPAVLPEPPRPPQRITQSAPRFEDNPNPQPPPRV